MSLSVQSSKNNNSGNVSVQKLVNIQGLLKDTELKIKEKKRSSCKSTT